MTPTVKTAVRGSRVLFVEGAGALHRVTAALAELGVLVVRVDSQELALEAMRLEPVDAVVLSYGIAGELGTGLMRELSRNEAIDPRRIVLLPAALAHENPDDSEATRDAVASVVKAITQPQRSQKST